MFSFVLFMIMERIDVIRGRSKMTSPQKWDFLTPPVTNLSDLPPSSPRPGDVIIEQPLKLFSNFGGVCHVLSTVLGVSRQYDDLVGGLKQLSRQIPVEEEWLITCYMFLA